MKPNFQGITAAVSSSPRQVRPAPPVSLREDRIFQSILPVRVQSGDFAAESPGDWGNRVLAEGDLSGSLLA